MSVNPPSGFTDIFQPLPISIQSLKGIRPSHAKRRGDPRSLSPPFLTIAETLSRLAIAGFHGAPLITATPLDQIT